MWVLGLLGCRTDCLPEVSGEDADEVAAVSSHAERFLDHLIPELAVCVPRIRVEETVESRSGEVAGVYDRTTHRVRVALPARTTVYHELCHAVQLQNDLPLDDPWWDPDPGFAASIDPRTVRYEVFGYTCQEALGWAWLVEDTCATDLGDARAFAAARALFVGPDDQVDLGRAATFTEAARVPARGASTFRLGLAPEGVLVYVGDRVTALDPATGARVASAGPTGFAGELAEQGGEALGAAVLRGVNGASLVRRVFVSADDRLTPAGCLGAGERSFGWAGAFGSAWLEDDAVVVGLWALGP